VAQVDGGDLRHLCPGARGAHPVVGATAMGTARRPAPRRVMGDAEGKKSKQGRVVADTQDPHGGGREGMKIFGGLSWATLRS
jgi:hypothetical protein